MNNSGSILIIVLWVSVILSILAISLAYRVSSELKITQVYQDRLKALYLVKAAVLRFIAELTRDSTPTSEIFKDFSLDGGRITFYNISDEEGRININTAPREILARLPGLTEETVASIIDWRDKDVVNQSGGAENVYYQNLDLPYNCKNSSFEALEELLLVKDMTPQILSNIKNLITVYTEGRVNINTAPRGVLLALGLDEGLIDRIIRYRAGKDKQEGTDDDNLFESIANIQEDLENFEMLTQEESLQIANLISNHNITVKSDNFRLNIVTALDNRDLTLKISAIVNRQGKIIYWQED